MQAGKQLDILITTLCTPPMASLDTWLTSESEH